MVEPKPGFCNARKTNRATGVVSYCGARPIKGRKRCKLHGGAIPRGLDHPHTKHGEQSEYIADQLKDLIGQRKADPNLGAATDHLAMLEVILAQRLDRLKLGKITAVQEDAVIKLVGAVKQLGEWRDRQMERRRELVPVDQARRAVLVFWQVFTEEAKDHPDIINRVFTRSRALLAQAGMATMPATEGVVVRG